MRRYVKELAKDKIRHLDGLRGDVRQVNIEHIERALKLCEKGYISDFEAVSLIIQTKGLNMGS